MVDNLRAKETTDPRSTENPSPDDCAEASTGGSGMMGCGMGKKGLKGMLMMAACCGVPVLLLLALPLMGSALGGLGTSAVRTLALLACPVGMVLMMWMMRRGQKAGTPRQAQTLPASLSRVDSMAPPRPREATVLQDIPDAGEDVVTSSSLTQEDVIKPSQSVNGQQPTVSTPAASRAEAAPPPQQ